MTITLITGANRGIGREVAIQLAARGHLVLIGTRDESNGAEVLRQIGCSGGRAAVVELDISSVDSIRRAAAAAQEFGGVDVLVNNAAITYDTWQSALDPDFDIVREALETNLYGTWDLTSTLVPQLRASAHPRIVNVSSGAGALGDMGGQLPAYRISKVALNALTRMWAAELPRARVNAVCPGWVATDMGGTGGRPVEAGAAGVVWAATLPDAGPTGCFFRDQQPIPW